MPECKVAQGVMWNRHYVAKALCGIGFSLCGVGPGTNKSPNGLTQFAQEQYCRPENKILRALLFSPCPLC
jgi:hypothetical protein